MNYWICLQPSQAMVTRVDQGPSLHRSQPRHAFIDASDLRSQTVLVAVIGVLPFYSTALILDVIIASQHVAIRTFEHMADGVASALS